VSGQLRASKLVNILVFFFFKSHILRVTMSNQLIVTASSGFHSYLKRFLMLQIKVQL